jgi:hypothetical protein
MFQLGVLAPFWPTFRLDGWPDRKPWQILPPSSAGHKLAIDNVRQTIYNDNDIIWDILPFHTEEEAMIDLRDVRLSPSGILDSALAVGADNRLFALFIYPVQMLQGTGLL